MLLLCCTQVIDAEIARRSLLEATPIPCTNEDAVVFDTATIPWWSWVKRFHLPEVRGRIGFGSVMHGAPRRCMGLAYRRQSG